MYQLKIKGGIELIILTFILRAIIPSNKNQASILRSLLIILKSLGITMAISLVWYFLLWDNFRLFPENEEVISAVVGGVLVFSALLPTFTISRLAHQADDMRRAIYKKDYEMFRYIHDAKVDPLIYQSIVILSVLAVAVLTMVPYQRAIVGFFAVGGLTFIHSFFYFVSREMDNPRLDHLGIKVPEEWMKKMAGEKAAEAKVL